MLLYHVLFITLLTVRGGVPRSVGNFPDRLGGGSPYELGLTASRLTDRPKEYGQSPYQDSGFQRV